MLKCCTILTDFKNILTEYCFFYKLENSIKSNSEQFRK